jgi:alpha-tubulin suppressor-like RCC1 family protein
LHPRFYQLNLLNPNTKKIEKENTTMRSKFFSIHFLFTLFFLNWLAACKPTTSPPLNLPVVGQGIVAWGDNRSGQLGDGSSISKRATVGAVNIDGKWNAIAAGEGHVLALRTDGTVWAWGENGKGQLGIGTNNNANTPFTTQINNVTAVAAGANHSLALKNDGTVWAWGQNNSGQLGDGANNDNASPVQVKAFFLVRAVAIAAGGNHSLAVDGNGEVWAWGQNDFGQLGDSTIANRSTPVKVKHLNNVIQVAAGANHSLALKSDGSVWAWGDRRHLQLGDGGNSPSLTPVHVPEGLPVAPQTFLSNIAAIAAGGDHNFAMGQQNSVWFWGSDKFAESSGIGAGGGLGAVAPDGTPVAFPQILQGISGKVVMVNAGTNHSLALTDDGRVWAWGRNDQGQLGDSTFIDPFGIFPVKTLRGAKAIAAGGGHSVALAMPSVGLDRTTLDFGNVQVNTSATLTVTLTNTSSVPAPINSFASSNSEFTFASSCTPPIKLAAAASCAIQVTFRPGSAGNRTATLFIGTDTPQGNLAIALSGNGR